MYGVIYDLVLVEWPWTCASAVFGVIFCFMHYLYWEFVTKEIDSDWDYLEFSSKNLIQKKNKKWSTADASVTIASKKPRLNIVLNNKTLPVD